MGWFNHQLVKEGMEFFTWAMKKNMFCSAYIRDSTTYFYKDYNGHYKDPWLTNQYMKSKAVIFSWPTSEPRCND